MLTMLVTLQQKVKTASGRLALCSMDQELMEVFRLTNLFKLFRMYSDESEAIQSFAKA
jgi:anti-anti-sigma regulatory factor